MLRTNGARWRGPAWPGPTAETFALGDGPVTVISGEAERELQVPTGVLQACVASDGTQLCVVREGAFEIWDVRTGEVRQTKRVPNGPAVRGPLIACGHYLASPFLQGDSCRSFILNVTTGELQNIRGRAATFSPDARSVATGSAQIAYLYQTSEPHQRVELFSSFGWVYDLAFSPSGALIAAACENAGVIVLDVATRERVADFPTVEAVCVAFGANDEELLAGTSDGIFTIDLMSPQRLRAHAQRFVHAPLSDADRKAYGI